MRMVRSVFIFDAGEDGVYTVSTRLEHNIDGTISTQEEVFGPSGLIKSYKRTNSKPLSAPEARRVVEQEINR